MGVCVQDGIQGSDHPVYLYAVTDRYATVTAWVTGPRAHLGSIADLVEWFTRGCHGGYARLELKEKLISRAETAADRVYDTTLASRSEYDAA